MADISTDGGWWLRVFAAGRRIIRRVREIAVSSVR
jgi:hypothetical protein